MSVNTMTVTPSSIPISLLSLLSKLRFLGSVERGKKINTNSMSFVDSTSWIGAISRYINSEDRKATITHINQVIHQTITAIEDYKQTEFLELIITDLELARLGIINLTVTYQHDPNIVSQLKVCLTEVEFQLTKNKEFIDSRKPKEDLKPKPK